MIHTCSLQSGSNGNCFYVETPDIRLLFDAGISGRQAQQRLQSHSRDIYDVDAIIISHNHSDHAGHAGVFQRKLSAPLYMTNGTWQACRAKMAVIDQLNLFEPGQVLDFNRTTVETIPTPHDGEEGVAFIVHYESKKLGIFTDLGHCFHGLEQKCVDLDMLYLESNYDPEMLRQGPYPNWLKLRITGNSGHISNQQAACLIKDCQPSRLKHLILSHLSQHNNHPDLALETAQSVLGKSFPVSVASRSAVSELFTV